MTQRRAYTFVTVHDNLLDHPAWMELDPVHVGCWVLALGYCRRNKTDGHLPVKAMTRQGATEQNLAELVAAGRLHEPGHDCADCPQPAPGRLYVHAYLAHQSSAAEQGAVSAARAEAGRRGGLAKASAKQVAKQPRSKSVAEGEGEGEREEKNTATAAASADFDRFWSIYPNRKGKAAAEKAWAKALTKTDVPTIAAALRVQVAEWQASPDFPKYVPHPTTWLNQGRWADEVATLPGVPGVGGASAYDLPPLPEPPKHVRDGTGRDYADWARATRAEQRAELERRAG